MFRPYPCEKWEDEVIFAVEKVTSEYRQTGAPKVPKRAVGPTSLSMKEFRNFRSIFSIFSHHFFIMSVASLATINSIRAYDEPLFVRVKERYLKKNHGKQIIQRTPLSLRRAMLVHAAYVKLQGIAGIGNMVTLNVLENFHPNIKLHDIDTIKQCTKTAVREVLLDFLSAQGSTETITKEAFTKYYEVMSFYVSAESSFERHMMTVYALSPVDVVTMASRRLDESIATSQLRSSFSRTGSIRSLADSYSSDRENEQQFAVGVNRSTPAMPTPPRTSKRANSTHSLRSKSFTENAASSVSGSKGGMVEAVSDLTGPTMAVPVVSSTVGNSKSIGIASIDINQRNKPIHHRSFDSSQRMVGDGNDDGGLRALMDSVYNSGGRRGSGGRSKTDFSPKKRRPSVTSDATAATASSSSSSSDASCTAAGYCTDGSAIAVAAAAVTSARMLSSSEPLSRRGQSSPSLLRDRNGEIKIVEVVTRRPAAPLKEKTTMHTSPSSSSSPVATAAGHSVINQSGSMMTSPHRLPRPPRSPRANGSPSAHPTEHVDSSSNGDKQPMAGLRRLQEENALLHKKIDLLRKKVQSMSAAAEQSQHAHLHLSPRVLSAPSPTPATASPVVAERNSSSDEMKNMFLGIISSLRSTIEAQDATINGQDLLIKALTTSS